MLNGPSVIVNSTPKVEFIVPGQPYSKANSRRVVRIIKDGKKKTQVIKSKEALAYVEHFQWQCPRLEPLLEGELWVMIDIWYASRRPDLDESLILDAMQNLIYKNDRQVRIKMVTGHVDRDNPRSVIRVGEIER